MVIAALYISIFLYLYLVFMSDNLEPSGFILINKPSGPTSHDIIDKLRRITGLKKIGHAGTLDPLASGLLICAIGRAATKQIDSFVKQDKVYEAEMVLGATSDTYDSQGVVIVKDCEPVSRELIEKTLLKFTGEQDQIPPMYSAKKVAGKKLYELARQGIEIKREPCRIVISELELISYEWPKVKIRVACSSGTYIRSLVYDIGEDLGVGAYMSALLRTRIGSFELAGAVELEDLSRENWGEYLI